MLPFAKRFPGLFPHPIKSSILHGKRSNQFRYFWRAPTSCKSIFHSQLRRFAAGPKQFPLPECSEPYETPLHFEPVSEATAGEENANLPSNEDRRRHAVTKKFSHLMDRVQSNLFIASQRINDITGYSGIEALKERVISLERNLEETQNAVRKARLIYKTTVTDRASSQREVTTLLARKDSWTPSDLERFTTLYRMDHSNEQSVQEASTRLADAEREVEHASSQLRSTILSRYHEEQIWSDKIRRMSTWGTWGLMGVNVLLFLVFQFGLEPWRRRRLIEGFEEKVLEALQLEKSSKTLDNLSLQQIPSDTVEAGDQSIGGTMDNEASLADPATTAVVTKTESMNVEESVNKEKAETPHISSTCLTGSRALDLYAAALKDLFSDRVVEVRKQDILIVAVKGALLGATIVTTIFTSILIRSSS